MNAANTNNNSMCNQNQILKTLPLKKRRIYVIDPPITTDDEHDIRTNDHRSYSQNDSLPKHVLLSPPPSPNIEFLRQQQAFFAANLTNIQIQHYLHPLIYDYLINQQSLDQQKCTGEDATIDEHFRKSLGDYYEKYNDRCLTPDDSSSNSSSIEQTSVDSIEEHFARSLAKFRSLNHDEISSTNHQKTESIVDDHFAKALGLTTWEKLKEKH